MGLPVAPRSADRPVALTVFVCNTAGTHQLDIAGAPPQIQVCGGAYALPETLAIEVHRQLALDVAFLRVLAPDAIAVESLDTGATLPPGCEWQPSTAASGLRAPWERPGWLAAIMPRVDRELTDIGMERVGAPAQMRHTSLSGMLRIPTTAGSVWLKAVPRIFAHEPLVIRWMRVGCDHAVPKVLAVRDDWWIAAEFRPAAGPPAADPLVVLAATQITSAARLDELRRLGCPDRPLSESAAHLSRIAARSDLLDAEQRRRLTSALRRIESACREMLALGFPPTLVHGDISPGNVRWVGDQWLIYDWTDACITHPFVELASPLSYEGDDGVASSRARAFGAAWSGVMPLEAVNRALTRSPIVGAAHQAVSYQLILDAIDRNSADDAGGRRLAIFLVYWIERLLRSLDC